MSLYCYLWIKSSLLQDLLALESGAKEQYLSLWLGYTESQGHPELRQAIAALYDNNTSDQVLVHSGAEEAIFNFMNVALEAGDHIIVHAPYYQSLAEVRSPVNCSGDP